MIDMAFRLSLSGRRYLVGFAAHWSEDVVFGSGNVRTLPTRPEKKGSNAQGLRLGLDG